MMPTSEQAFQFALMLQAGLPASEAILYFTDSSDPAEVAAMLAKWMRSRAFKEATLKLMGRPWHEMGLEEKIRHALDIHYAGLAYLLFSHNYAEVGPGDKAKLDSARQSLEAKLAGQAGRGDELSRFLNEVATGKLRLPAAPSALKVGTA